MTSTSGSQRTPKKHPIRFSVGLVRLETQTLLGGLLALAMLAIALMGLVAIIWGLELRAADAVRQWLSSSLAW